MQVTKEFILKHTTSRVEHIPFIKLEFHRFKIVNNDTRFQVDVYGNANKLMKQLEVDFVLTFRY